MKIASTIKWQMGLVALGASLLLASSSFAQQEISPVFFEAPASSTDGGFNTPTQAVQAPQAATGELEYAASVPLVDPTKSEMVQTEVANLSHVAGWGLLALLAFAGLVVLGGIASSTTSNPAELLRQIEFKIRGLQARRHQAVTT